MRVAQGTCLSDGLDTEGVTEPTVFHEVQNPPDGCNLEVGAIGIISETNPPGIDSAADPEAGPDSWPRLGTIPSPTTEGWTVAPQSQLEQEAGPVRTRPPQFSTTNDQKSEGTVGSCLVRQSLHAFDALPNVPADINRQSHKNRVQKSFYAGMYTHGGISALRATCREHAESIKTFTALIRAVHPKQIFTSLVVLDGSQNSLHRDSRNACVPNLVVPLTSFSGGELFLEKPDGELHTVGERTLRGEIIPLSEGPVAFDARHVSHGAVGAGPTASRDSSYHPQAAGVRMEEGWSPGKAGSASGTG